MTAMTAIAAAGAAAAVSPQPGPEVWSLLGYPFYAAGMIAAIFACSCALIYRYFKIDESQKQRLPIFVSVCGIVLASSVCSVLALKPDPGVGLAIGAGFGMMGEGLFHLAEKRVSERIAALLGTQATPRTPGRKELDNEP